MATATFLFSEITSFHLVIVLVGCAFYLHIDKITRGTCLFCLNVCKMKKYYFADITSFQQYCPWQFTENLLKPFKYLLVFC